MLSSKTRGKAGQEGLLLRDSLSTDWSIVSNSSHFHHLYFWGLIASLCCFPLHLLLLLLQLIIIFSYLNPRLFSFLPFPFSLPQFCWGVVRWGHVMLSYWLGLNHDSSEKSSLMARGAFSCHAEAARE